MDQKLTAIKAAVAAFFSALGVLLGWKGVMVVAWFVAMVLDYVSGTCAAAKNGEWSSSIARQGLWHKGGMIMVVIIAVVADALFASLLPHIPIIHVDNPGLLLPLVLAWYIITEAGSVLENAVKMGAPVPKWFAKILKISLDAVDKAAGEGSHDNDSSADN